MREEEKPEEYNCNIDKYFKIFILDYNNNQVIAILRNKISSKDPSPLIILNTELQHSCCYFTRVLDPNANNNRKSIIAILSVNPKEDPNGDASRLILNKSDFDE